MLGSLLKKARNDKEVTKAHVARTTGINIGHLTHIEKGERNPSHKALKSICAAIGIPFMPLFYTYDRFITEDQTRYKLLKHISYDKVPCFNSMTDFMTCPASAASASFAVKMNDDSMDPFLKKDSYIFVELNANLNAKDVGVFLYDNEILVRRFIIRKNELILRADNKTYPEIQIDENTDFTIIGRVHKGY